MKAKLQPSTQVVCIGIHQEYPHAQQFTLVTKMITELKSSFSFPLRNRKWIVWLGRG